VVDNTLWYSEAVTSGSLGTVLRVALPTAEFSAPVPTVAGDTVTVRWGDQTLTALVSATNINNRYVDFTVTQAQLESQSFGNVTVSASVTSAASGNTSLTSPLVVNWNYNLPLAELASLSQGFEIQGNVSAGRLAYSNERLGLVNVGDVNGDGFDDVEVSDINGTRYIVYGGDRLGAVNVSQMSVAGNSFGFAITGAGTLEPTRGGDINGDGLSDILVGGRIIFGKSTSIGEVAIGSLGTNGFTSLARALRAPCRPWWATSTVTAMKTCCSTAVPKTTWCLVAPISRRVAAWPCPLAPRARWPRAPARGRPM
jgi:hypothetical protein